MDFKFGRNIQRVHPNKSPLKTLEKMERIQGLPKVFKYPVLPQEQVKLWTSNLVGTWLDCSACDHCNHWYHMVIRMGYTV